MPQQENSSSFYRDLEQRLEQLHQQGQWRELRRSDYGLPEMTFEGTRYLNLSSNDYLGLANDAALRGEFLSRVQDTRLGATGSRLMTGNTLPYADFEQQLERTYGLPALVFGSGYHANTGVLPALVSSGDLVLADRLVHASILDGVLASKADFQRYRHNDYEHLETLLARNRSRYRYVWIVSETIFSMDGDRADLARLVDLKNRYEALLYLDEAHSIGTDGEDGLGMCRQAGVLEQVDVAVFPMGKAMASHGAFVLAKRPLRDYLVNTSRPMIFSTALPPVCVAWSAFVFSHRSASVCSTTPRNCAKGSGEWATGCWVRATSCRWSSGTTRRFCGHPRSCAHRGYGPPRSVTRPFPGARRGSACRSAPHFLPIRYSASCKHSIRVKDETSVDL